MNTPPENPDSRWENLLRQARADIPPPTDVAALLRAVRLEPMNQPRSGWATDFAQLFASSRMISGCLAGAGAFALIATWQVWDSWQTLPWVQLLDAATGGAS